MSWMVQDTQKITGACCERYDDDCVASFKRHGKFTSAPVVDAAPHPYHYCDVALLL